MTKEFVSIKINGQTNNVPAGISVAAAIALSGNLGTRISISGQIRAPLCGMGICQECRVQINGRAHQLACQTACRPGMEIETGVTT
jgi:predicted molibdopterin-dependent oxidoreductase YjgC